MGPDPAAMATRYGTGSNSNYAGWSNAEFDRLCAEAAAEGDEAKRAEEAVQKLTDKFVKDVEEATKKKEAEVMEI